MNKQKMSIILIVVLMIFPLSVHAAITRDETKMYIKEQPLNFINSGEDCTYYKWIDKYEQKRQNYVKNITSIETKAIIGNIKGEYIEYDPIRDVKNISLNLEKINQARDYGDITGMFFENGKLYVAIEDKKFSKKEINCSRYPEDIAVIIRGIFTSQDHCIWQTIDPPPNIADMEKYGLVYYGGMVEDTHVGMVMFEADRIMKCISGGYDNRTGKPLNIQGAYHSEWDYMPEISFDEQYSEEEWHRYWFTTEDTIVQYDPDSKVVKIMSSPLSIKTERMEMIHGKLESTFDPDYNSRSYKWTKHFEANLLYYAKYYPVLYELHELSRWVSLFNALYETGFVFEEFNFNIFPKVATPIKTPVIQIIKERITEIETQTQVETSARQIILTGGVGLEQVTLQKSDLSTLKEQWIDQYKNGSYKVVCICD